LDDTVTSLVATRNILYQNFNFANHKPRQLCWRGLWFY
jgi:hypothetical protein